MKDFIVDEDETFDQEDKFDDNQDSEDIEVRNALCPMQ